MSGFRGGGRRGASEWAKARYRRKGTANVFVYLDATAPGAGSRSPTDGRTQDFARLHARFVDVHCQTPRIASCSTTCRYIRQVRSTTNDERHAALHVAFRGGLKLKTTFFTAPSRLPNCQPRSALILSAQ